MIQPPTQRKGRAKPGMNGLELVAMKPSCCTKDHSARSQRQSRSWRRWRPGTPASHSAEIRVCVAGEAPRRPESEPTHSRKLITIAPPCPSCLPGQPGGERCRSSWQPECVAPQVRPGRGQTAQRPLRAPLSEWPSSRFRFQGLLTLSSLPMTSTLRVFWSLS